MIKRKFTNRLNNYIKKQKSGVDPLARDFFDQFIPRQTGRQLFETEHRDDINSEATKRREAAGETGRHAGFYQTVLKEMWNACGDQQAYVKRADEVVNDVVRCVNVLYSGNTCPNQPNLVGINSIS